MVRAFQRGDLERAAAFYRREGFRVQYEGADKNTGEAECRMVWERREPC